MWQDRLDDIAALHQRKVILRIPARHIELAVRVDLPNLESLECGGFIAEEFDAQFVEVVGADTERHICAPVIRIAPERDKAARFEGVDDIGRGRDRNDLGGAFGKVNAVPLSLLQDRAQTGQKSQLTVLDVEREADGTWSRLLHCVDPRPETTVARMSDSAECLIGPHDIFDGHRAAVRETCLFAQGKFDPLSIRSGLDRFGQHTIERERFIQ